MGCGKTEAALAAAYQLIAAGKATGLYFALPTQVTSNRIHLRVQPFVERISADPAAVRLAHSASWLVETEPPPKLCPASPDAEAREHVRAGRSWFASAKRALLAPFGVGTIDQALLGIVAAKHFFVRQFGLAGKVVILDEVHTYDLYTSTLIGALVKRLRELQCTVIILSATLTEKRRRELLGLADDQPVSAAYPLVSGVAGSLHRARRASHRHRRRFRYGTSPVPCRWKKRWIVPAAANVCCGFATQWMRHKRPTGRFRAPISKAAQASRCCILASPFSAANNSKNDWMNRLGKDSTNRPNGCVLVSTQVAEQSVDIDADLLITDLAPTDMLLQRLGRLWRHDRRTVPVRNPKSGFRCHNRMTPHCATRARRNFARLWARAPASMRPTSCCVRSSSGAGGRRSRCRATSARFSKPPTPTRRRRATRMAGTARTVGEAKRKNGPAGPQRHHHLEQPGPAGRGRRPDPFQHVPDGPIASGD